MLFKLIWTLAENFSVSRNLAENSNSRQNTAPGISRIFYLAGFIFLNYGYRVSTHTPSSRTLDWNMSNAPTKYIISSGKQSDYGQLHLYNFTFSLTSHQYAIDLVVQSAVPGWTYCALFIYYETTPSIAYSQFHWRRLDADCTLWADSQSRHRP